MQIKKNPREGQYQDPRVPQFEAEDDANLEESYEAADASRVSRNRQPEPETTDTAPVRAPARQESLVDAHSSFDGRYETDQDLRVNGTISGEVVCRGLLTIEQEATARAKIQTRDAQVRGRLEGDIVCSGKLTLAATAVVSGTLKAATFVVEEGATLNGTVETATVPIASVPSAQEPAAPATPPAASSRSGPNWSGERERERKGSAAASSDAAPTSGTRNGRQAPTFAFVPSSEERSAAADRN